MGVHGRGHVLIMLFNQTGILCRALVLLSAWVVSGWLTGMQFPRAGELGQFDGSFIQPLDAHRSWDEARWADTFDCLAASGVRELVVQWTSIDDNEFVERRTANGPSVAERILGLADQRGMKVWLGLAHDTAFWQRLRADNAGKRAYLADLRQRSKRLAARMAPLARTHRSFAGWYIPEEVDEVTWQGAEDRRALSAHLDDLSRFLRLAAPKARIAISGFSNGRESASNAAAFWSQLLLAVPNLDVVMFQDGVGLGTRSLDETRALLAAVSRSTKERAREFVVVTEVFVQTAGTPLDERPFAAKPASAERVGQQLAMARALGAQTVAFSLPEYACKKRSADSAEQ